MDLYWERHLDLAAPVLYGIFLRIENKYYGFLYG
jgi:hypothetical protein